ncbi:MAG: SH3 domain-containing protein [Alphaproteobacteria bacterium]|nr:SH3 domain-containing protein [Alphaproteobacteria bacterium]
MRFGLVVGAALVCMLVSSLPARADDEKTQPQIPTCSRPLGAITIVDGDRRGWTVYDLQSPQKLLKLYVQKSGCFTLVDRGTGFDAAQKERELEAQGTLQRRSNVGGGQVRAADYVLVAEVVAADRDTGGSAVGGIIGGIVGGPIGGAIGGGLRTRDLEAQAILSVTDVRTSETKAVEEGRAKKTDVSFALGAGGGGWGGWGGVVGGGYEDTPIGQVVSLAFLDAYVRLVNNLGALPADAKSVAPERAYQTMRATKLRKFPDPGATVVRSLEPGMRLYPLGEKDGAWWKVEDENGNQGWVKNTDLEPLR